MSNKKKHQILKVLFEKYRQGESETKFGKIITDTGRSVTNIDLHKQTNIPVGKIDDLCNVLAVNGHIIVHGGSNDVKAFLYLITDTGKAAYIDKYYLGQVWYRKPELIISLLAFLIALGTFVRDTISHTRNDQRIDTIQGQIKKLEGK